MAVGVGVVAAVRDQRVRPTAGMADEAGDRGNRVEQRQQLGDLMVVAAGQRRGQRQAVAVYQEVMLGTRRAPIDRALARFGAPFFACIWLESTIARDHSISPAARNRASSTACTCSHTPARCHSSSRRQHVTPDPNPSSNGKSRQATPVCNTNKIPDGACRSGRRFRPR